MRKIYIVPTTYDPIKAAAEAVVLGTGEVVQGIPPALKNMVSLDMLPCIYSEPVSAPAQPPELDVLKTKCANL